MSEGPNTVQNEPLNILMLVDSLGIGGTETHVLAIAKVLQKKAITLLSEQAAAPWLPDTKTRAWKFSLCLFNQTIPFTRTILPS